MYSLTYYLYYYYHTSNQATYLSSKYLLVSSIILRIEDPARVVEWKKIQILETKGRNGEGTSLSGKKFYTTRSNIERQEWNVSGISSCMGRRHSERNRLIGSPRWPYFVSSDLRVTGCVTSISYLSRAPEESISFIRSTSAIRHLSFPFVLLFFFFLSFDWIISSSFLSNGMGEGGQRKVRSCERWAMSRLVKSRTSKHLKFRFVGSKWRDVVADRISVSQKNRNWNEYVGAIFIRGTLLILSRGGG